MEITSITIPATATSAKPLKLGNRSAAFSYDRLSKGEFVQLEIKNDGILIAEPVHIAVDELKKVLEFLTK